MERYVIIHSSFYPSDDYPNRSLYSKVEGTANTLEEAQEKAEKLMDANTYVEQYTYRRIGDTTWLYRDGNDGLFDKYTISKVSFPNNNESYMKRYVIIHSAFWPSVNRPNRSLVSTVEGTANTLEEAQEKADRMIGANTYDQQYIYRCVNDTTWLYRDINGVYDQYSISKVAI